MCLIVKKGTRKIVIRKDRIVWKHVRTYPYNGKAVTALYNDFQYVRGVAYEQALCKMHDLYGIAACDSAELAYFKREFYSSRMIDLVECGIIDCYGAGFHFFETRKRAEESYEEVHDPGDKVERFVIPKGATIILSGNGVGITNRIIYSPE